MYDVSALWNSLITELDHSFQVKVAINGIDYGSDYIRNLRVEQNVFGGSNPGVGACTSSEIDLVIDKPSEAIPAMATIEPFVRVTDGSDLADEEGHHSEWIPQGIFYIDTREVTQNDDNMPIMTIHGYDGMLKTEADYPTTRLEWPADDIDVVAEIADFLGINVDNRTWDVMTDAYQISLPAGYSMREVLGYIGAMYAGNWVMTYDGELLLVVLGGIPPETNYLIDYNGNPITFGRPEEQKSASGSVVQFDDGNGSAFDDVTVTIDPVQDLHGYEYPWPPGGGKNLLKLRDGTFNIRQNVNATISNGALTITGSSTSSGGRTSGLSDPFLLPAGTYIMSPLPGSPYVRGHLNRVADNTVVGNYSGIAFTTTQDETVYFGVNIEANQNYNITIYPQLEKGSSITSYVPYSNVCPITGHDGVNVIRAGKNLFTAQGSAVTTANIEKTINGSKIRYKTTGATTTTYWIQAYSSVPYFFKAGMTYTMSVRAEGTFPSRLDFRFEAYDTSRTDGVNINFTNLQSGEVKTRTFTPEKDCDDYANARIAIENYPSSSTFDVTLYVQLEVGSLETAYTPYIGQVIPVAFPASPGVVYGGSLDVTTGVLTVDRATYTIDDATLVGRNDGYRYYILQSRTGCFIPSANSTDVLCDRLKSSAAGRYDNSCFINNSGAIRWNTSAEYPDNASMLAGVGGSLQFVYPLATVQTYQLTPQQIDTLIYDNVIYCDTGNISVAYTYGGEVTRILV